MQRVVKWSGQVKWANMTIRKPLKLANQCSPHLYEVLRPPSSVKDQILIRVADHQRAHRPPVVYIWSKIVTSQRLHTRAGTEQLDRERKDHQAD